MLGLNLREFYELSPNELYEALLQNSKEIENKKRFEMELMRLQTFYLINIQLDSKSSLSNPRELMRFYWEEEEYDETKVTVPDWSELDKKYGGG